MALYNRMARLLADYGSTHRSCRQITQFVRSNEKRVFPVTEMIEESNLSKFDSEVQCCQGAELKLKSEVEKLLNDLNDLKNDLEKCKIELKGELKTYQGVAKQVEEIGKKLDRDVHELKVKLEGNKTEFGVLTALGVTAAAVLSAVAVAAMRRSSRKRK